MEETKVKGKGKPLNLLKIRKPINVLSNAIGSNSSMVNELGNGTFP